MSCLLPPLRWFLVLLLIGPLLAGCEWLDRFDDPETRINTALPPDSGVQAARQRLLSHTADRPELQQAFESRWATRLRTRAVLCRRDYQPSWRDSDTDIRMRLSGSECFVEFDRSLERWIGFQRVQMVLSLPALRTAPAELPLLISHREHITHLVPAAQASVALLQGSRGFDLVDLGTGKALFSESASSSRPVMTLSPNGRVFSQTAGGRVALRTAEGGETLVELPDADAVLWLNPHALLVQNNSSSTGQRGLRLLDLASGEETPVPGQNTYAGRLIAPVPGTADRFTLLLAQGAEQIELSNASGRYEARLRNEVRSDSGGGFGLNTGGMTADGRRWVDGHQGLRLLNLDTLELQERSFLPARLTYAWPTADPDKFVLSLATPSGNGITSVVEPYVYSESAGTLAKLERGRGQRLQYVGSIRRLVALEGLNLRYLDAELPTEAPLPVDTLLSRFADEINQRRLAAAFAPAAATGSGPGGLAAGGQPTALQVQLRDAVVEGVGVYEGMGASQGGGGRPRMPGHVIVRVKRSAAPIALVLASYEPVRWRIVPEPGARLAAVLVSSHHPSTVDGAGTARVYQMGQGYAYQRQSAEFIKLQRATQEWTGKPFSVFQGSYNGGQFSVGG